MSILPFCSIIIPTFNRAQSLNACLIALSNLHYPKEKFEIIIINDGGKQLLNKSFVAFNSVLNIQFFNQANQGPAAARNQGAKLAKGQYLAFLDDDCQPHPNWLLTLVYKVKLLDKTMVGGQTINQLNNNKYAEASQLLVDYLYQSFNENHQNASFFTSNNMLLPTTLFHQLNGFDANFPLAAAEDREFCIRWKLAGFKMIYVPEATIYHAHFLDLFSFWKQHYNYGMGIFLFHQKFKQLKGYRKRLAAFSFYWQLISYPFRVIKPIKAVLLVGLLVLAQIANLVGFLKTAAQKETKVLEKKCWQEVV